MSLHGGHHVIFGGAGFIGSHLAAELVDRGADVIVADIVAPSRPVAGVRYETCDVRAPIEVPCIETATAVYNLAAVHRTPGHPDHEYYDTNVAGALNVTDWCERAGVRNLCFTSSISVYGPTEELKDEQSALRPNSSYGRSKLLAEQVHEGWLRRGTGRRLVVARPAVVFGPGENGNFTRLAQALRQRRFVYPGRRDTIKSCGYVTDLVAALLFGLGRDETYFLFNFAYPRRYTIEDICQAFARVAGYPEPRALPPAIIRAGSSSGAALGARALVERVRKLTMSTNIAPDTLERSGFIWDTELTAALERWRAATGSFT